MNTITQVRGCAALLLGEIPSRYDLPNGESIGLTVLLLVVVVVVAIIRCTLVQ